MIVGERHRQHLARLKFIVHPHRLHTRPRQSEDRYLRIIHNRRKTGSANAAQVRDGEGPAFHVPRSQLLITGFVRQLRQLGRQFDDVFLVNVTNYRYQKSAISINCNPDVDELLIDDFFLLHVNAGIELRENFQCGSTNF